MMGGGLVRSCLVIRGLGRALVIPPTPSPRRPLFYAPPTPTHPHTHTNTKGHIHTNKDTHAHTHNTHTRRECEPYKYWVVWMRASEIVGLGPCLGHSCGHASRASQTVGCDGSRAAQILASPKRLGCITASQHHSITAAGHQSITITNTRLIIITNARLSPYPNSTCSKAKRPICGTLT